MGSLTRKSRRSGGSQVSKAVSQVQAAVNALEGSEISQIPGLLKDLQAKVDEVNAALETMGKEQEELLQRLEALEAKTTQTSERLQVLAADVEALLNPPLP